MAFPPQFLDEIRDRLSLAGVVGRHVKLARRGREYVGLCPFHSEKTPSFTVVEDKAFYHCFGCGAHGDVIGFAMRVAGAGFRETVEQLAKEAGLRVPDELPEDRERQAQAMSLHDACDAACAFFEDQLKQPGGRAARDYLARRGLSAETIARFRLGWAPDSRDALKRALGGKFAEPLLIEAGLLRQAETRDSYDFFRGRVIFPICDRAGKIMAFGGRVIGDGQPKYLNSPDTPIFDKGRTLYGAHIARAAPRSDLVPIVTEGYMDVIALHQAGFAGAVAPLGTALTETQLLELWRLGDRPILCFDGDAAGRRAAVRALDRGLPLLRHEVGLRFVLLPENEDPDSLIRSRGEPVFRSYLEGAMEASEFTWRVTTEDRDASFFATPERILRLQARLGKRIRLIENGAVQREFQHYLMDRVWDIRRRLRRGRELDKAGGISPALRASGAAGWADETRRRHLETLLVAFAINHPEVARSRIDSLAGLEVRNRDLNDLWQHVTDRVAKDEALTGMELRSSLDVRLSAIADRLFASAILQGKSFVHFAAEREWAETGWKATLAKYHLPIMEREREEAITRWTEDATEQAWEMLAGLQQEIARLGTESDFVHEQWEGGGAPPADGPGTMA
ncbi:MAG TPA: DNA primase [Stellaceae bacterium]|nr:DNA primase [Stellaceae bacterium]